MTYLEYLAFALIVVFVDAMHCAAARGPFWLFWSMLLAAFWPITVPLLVCAIWLHPTTTRRKHEGL